MPKPVFVDTGFVIALINEDDDHHEEAQILSDRYENSPFITDKNWKSTAIKKPSQGWVLMRWLFV